jgi:hypothetical protein
MSSRSGAADASEAFELFLDTASNAFGGVVFISLLVCILLQLTGTAGRVQEITHDPNVAIFQQQVEDLTGEVAKLLAIRGTQAAELDKARKEREARGTIEVKFADLLANKERKAEELSKLEEENKKLDAEPRPRPPKRHVGGGTAQATTKKQVPVMLSAGRMCFLHKYDDRGEPLGINESQVEGKGVVQATGVRFFSPRPGIGLKVEDTPGFDARLMQLLKNFSGQRHTIAVAVWPDSYREFEVLRKKISGKDFGYFLLLMKEGEPVGVSAQGESKEMRDR